mgnify:FL=1|jgi:hypothetical protein|nr:MAG TPA: hypothetical protein [Caudoviricetes sp.]
MSKNLIPEIVKMLGLQLGEEFKVEGYDELTYRFAGDGLKLTYDNNIELSDIACKAAFAALLNGKDEIVKLPWKPKERDIFYSFSTTYGKWVVRSNMWAGAPCDYALLDKGWVYRTRAEAETALPAVAAELGVDYEL